MSARFRIIFSAAFALLGVVSCLAYADTVRQEAERVRSDAIERFGGEVASLVVATQAIEVGETITERNVRMRDWVADLAPVGAMVSVDDVLGREVSVPVAEGAPLTELNFRDGMALSEVPAGHVAVSVPVTDKLGISRSVTRGMRVSAYAVSGDETRLIATDVEVLSELASSLGAVTSQQVAIAVLPTDVSEVLAASASGNLRLVIPADDVEVTDVDAGATDAPPEEVDPSELEDSSGEGDAQ